MSERGALGIFRGLETSCGREGLFCAGYLGMGPVRPLGPDPLTRHLAYRLACRHARHCPSG